MLSHHELSTPPPEVEAIRKEYENMSYDEMSQRLAESYKEFEQLLGNRISIPSSASSDTEDEASTQVKEDDDCKKKKNVQKQFIKACTSSVENVKPYLEMKDMIDIDAKDEDGTTPLIYAACFGKLEIVQELLLAGANTDIQDAHGWSALMWATTNKHEALVKLLLDHGASAQTKSATGRTVYDFAKSDSQKMAEILNPRDSMSSTSSLGLHTEYSSISSNAGDADRYYQYTTDENYEHFLSMDSERRPKLMDEYLFTDSENEGDGDNYNHDDDDDEDGADDSDEEDDEDKEVEFYWDKCMPDQMFVFGADDLSYILDTVISNLTLPVRNVQEIFLPANVVFLCARFAHYFSSEELAEDVMEGGLSRLGACVKKNVHDVANLAYWLTNMTRLLYYLKKDTGLVVTTAEYQLRLSELISETYNLIVNDVGANITAILEQAMLEHDPITDLEQVDFTDDWQRFFRRSTSRRSTMDDTQMQRQSSQFDHSEPRTITNILTSTLYVLQSYEVHSTVIIQCLAQFFHTLSCELFNRMLTKKKYLSRSKALQVRMNLSVVEDWIRKNNLPSSMIGYLNPSVQLLQLLQCLTQLTDIESFKSTIEEFDTVNPLQIKRCVLNYRYETNENRLPEMIETYVNQCAEETIKFKQTRSSRTLERNSIQSIQSQSLRRSLSARDSMSQIMGSFMSTHPAETNTNTDENEVEDKEIKETKDSRFMLPFMVPTTAQLAHVSGWSHRKEDKVTLVPVVPEEWMDKLDKNNKL